jgi:UDP-N-acetylmuramate dehydrogenase
MNEVMKKRKDAQPLNFPNAGSIFKRPPNNFAGKLIEEAGLKGYSIGGAEVSTKHAGFIINRGGAKAEDVQRLIEYVKEKVLENSGVSLECEVEFF